MTSDSSAGLTNSTHARGNTRSTSGTASAVGGRDPRQVPWDPCASASWTSGPTPGTCSWSTPTEVRRRCRRSPTSSRCGWPSTSTSRVPSTRHGIDALTSFTAESLLVAEDKGCEDMIGFATSAVRDAVNSDAVLEHVRERTGVRIDVLSGEDEARLTFLAVRRWFGWSAGRLAVFDIGGGSLEIAGGADEAPDVAWSLPLGAARLARTYFSDGAAERRRRPRDPPRDPRRDRPRRGPPAPRRRPRPRGRDVQDVPLAGPDLRRGAVRRRRAGAAHPAPGGCASGSPSWSRCRPRSSRRCRASRRAAGTRSSPEPWSPRGAWTSSVSPSSRSARGRSARA